MSHFLNNSMFSTLAIKIAHLAHLYNKFCTTSKNNLAILFDAILATIFNKKDIIRTKQEDLLLNFIM